jgi:hypothetical protein
MAAVLHAVVAVLLAACASTPSLPGEPADISGIITRVERTSGRTTVLIEERPGQASGHDKSSVRITAGTRILLDGPSGATPYPAERLTTGSRASAWFVGPVAESYPTQATAGVLVVRPR